MLRILGHGRQMCDGFTRREVMQVGAISSWGGLSLQRMLSAASHKTAGPAKSVILINLIGGPSHIDMFDMKPEAPSEIRGEFNPINSSVPGLQICEWLPRTALTMQHSALIRTHSHLYNTHSPYNMLTGYSGPVVVNNVAKQTDHPCIGSVMQFLGMRSPDTPSFVWMPAFTGHSQSKRRAGPYGGFLGHHYDPLFTVYEPQFRENTSNRNAHINPPTPYAEPLLPALDALPQITLDRLDRRQTLLEQIDDQRDRLGSDPSVNSLSYFQQKALEVLTSSKTRDAFDLTKEPDSVRSRYGEDLFGSCVLTARKLIEAGVRFVGLTTESHLNGKIGAGQWDTHGHNFQLLKNFNLPMLDQYYSALIEDLDQRGLLDSTLVILMGEMGRTPKINKNAGRDHWTQCGFILLTGGGIKQGTIYGRSDKHAAWPVDRPVSSADHVATIYQLLGIDPTQMISDQSGRPIPVALGGEPIWDVIA